MIKKEITYSLGQTIQLADYTPTNLHYSIKAELEEGDKVPECFRELKNIVGKQVAQQVGYLEEFKKAKGKSLVVPVEEEEPIITIKNI